MNPAPSTSIALVRIALGSGDLQVRPVAPLALRIGQELVAEVLVMRAGTDRALLAMAGRRFEAQVPPGLREGQVVRLSVAAAAPERLVLRVLPPLEMAAQGQPAGTGAPGTVPVPGSVLADLDLPDTPPFRAAAQALLEQGQPLTREAVLVVRNAMGESPELVSEAARAAARLILAGIPPTTRALDLARVALAQGQAPLADLLRDLVDAVRRPASDAPAGDPGRTGATGGLSAVAGKSGSVEGTGNAGSAGNPGVAAGQAAFSPQTIGARATPMPARDRIDALVAALTRLTQLPRDGAGLGRVVEAFGLGPEPRLAAPLPVAPATTPVAAPAPPPDPASATGLLPAPPPAAIPAPEPGATRVPPLPADARSILAAIAGAAAELRDAPLEHAPAIHVLAAALHDRIEWQQVANAARQQRQLAPMLAQTMQQALEVDGVNTKPPPSTGGFFFAPGSPALTFSIPLAAAGQWTTLELEVEPDPPAKRDAQASAAAGVRARLSLELPHLGPIGADLRLAGRGDGLRCRVTAQPGAPYEALLAATRELQTRLERSGFVARVECAVAEPWTLATDTWSLRRVDVEA